MYEQMYGHTRFLTPTWTWRHTALVHYLEAHWGWFVAPGVTAPTLAAQLKTDPAWRALCQRIGSPDVQLVREAASALLPGWVGLDVDLVAEGARLACAGDVPAGLVLLGVAAVVLIVALALKEQGSQP